MLFTWDYLTKLRVHKRDQHSEQAGDNEPKEALDIRTLRVSIPDKHTATVDVELAQLK